MKMKQILGSVAILTAACAFADGRGYEPRTVTINAGVIAFSQNDTAVRDVYTFYAMDRRTDLKPLGLVFRNPLAPSRDADGDPITRNEARYWLVDLSRITDAQLARYQILLLSRTNLNGMDDRIRERLRRFVDSGGMLWVEMPPTASGELWFPRVSLSSVAGTVNIVNLNHPLLRGYYTLSPSEVASLGLRGRGFGGGALNISAADPVLQIVSAVNPNAPVIAAATYGSGRIIVSAARVAGAINAPFTRGDGSTPRPASDFRMEAVPDLELKFAYNIIRWAGAGSTDAFNPRRANAVADQYGAPLAVRWRDRNTTYNLQDGTPLVYGGLVFVVSNSKLICYDAVPKRDLDGDGRADDGVLDLERGESFDKVWEVTLPGQASPPVAWESPDGVNVIVVVGTEVHAYRALPRDNQGRIPPVGQLVPGWPISNPAPGAAVPTTADGQIPAPIVIENKLLIVPSNHALQGSGQTAGFYAVLLTSPPRIIETAGILEPRWFLPRNTGAGDWLLPPVAGYVPNLGQGGGNDLVIYFGVRTDPTNTGGQVVEGIRAFWLGAKGERLIPQVSSDDVYQGSLRTRLSGRGAQMAGLVPEGSGVAFRADPSNPLSPRVYELERDALGNITSIRDITSNCRFNERGDVLLGLANFSSANIYVIDYFIDWARPAQFNTVFRTYASLPAYSDASGVPPQKLRGYTLAPNGVLYITTGTDSLDPNAASGNIIALQEQLAPAQQQARGGSKVLWRWQSHGGYQQVIPRPERAEPVIVPPSNVYNEPNEYFMRFVGNLFRFSHNFVPNSEAQPQRRWMNFAFVGAPIYYDGAVYAIAQGQARLGPFPVPYLVLLALDAEPEQFIIDLGAPISASGDITISQRDYGRSGSNPITNVVSTLTYSSSAPNPDIKVISTLSGAQIRITSFAQAGGGGQLNLLENVLSLTQPVLVNTGGTAPLWIDPDRIAGNWNNLRWYAVLLGQQAQANPVLVGDILYIPCQITVPTDNGLETFGGILGVAADPYRLQPDLAQRKDQVGTVPRVDPVNPLRYQSVIRWPFIDDVITNLEEDPDPFAFL
ncbi:MAG: hypothetical protein NZ556_05245, partial [Fimbriimonadales bacterium]|nr:hypothetical protein [Fimbriimonadales bacterium]